VFDAVHILGPDGPLAQALSHYEYRTVQLEMAKGVQASLSSGRHLVVEAGTGVGKSFAYLIPAIAYALQQKKKVIISTHTISLQEQLIQKDIPMLAQVLPAPFRAVLVKGRGNYISLRRLKRAVEHSFDLFEKDESVEALGRILEWSTLTQSGSLQDLHEKAHEEVWDKVVSDADNCLGKKCPTYRQCFFFSARRRMEEADLLIVNHHLFFSDLSLRRGGLSFLPNYDAVIFDEAHTLEQVAAEHMGFELSNSQIRFLLDSLLNAEGTKGFLISFEDPATRKWVQTARKELQRFFKEIEEYLKEFPEARRVRQGGLFSETLVEVFREIRDSLGKALKEARNKEEELDIQSYRKRCEAIAFSLECFLKQDLGKTVYWVSRSKHRFKKITLHGAPIHCGEILEEELFQKVRSVIMTSATLSTEGNFTYFKDRHGIRTSDEMLLGSPFNYRKQVTLRIPVGMPDPADYERFRDYVFTRVRERLKEFDGGVFVLFTSHRLMRDVYSLLRPFLEEKGLRSFQQGESLSRHEMLEAFKADGNSVLFGTDSFWQGVDVPGRALSQVIITKLPFSVPDHPMIEARIEELEARGEDPFLTYTLPEAILKLKQGFGRLIRTQTDRGSVVILDDRILRKPYGLRFLKSLPECELTIG